MSFLEILEAKYGLKPTSTMEKELSSFDPKALCGTTEGSFLIPRWQHQLMVGKAVRLIHDMADAGASEEEMIRAIKYGVVTIDAVKGGLNYLKAEVELGIDDLHERYWHKKSNM